MFRQFGTFGNLGTFWNVWKVWNDLNVWQGRFVLTHLDASHGQQNATGMDCVTVVVAIPHVNHFHNARLNNDLGTLVAYTHTHTHTRGK